MAVLSKVFGRFFNKFETRHNEILERFENGKLGPRVAVLEIRVNARDCLSKNDPRSMAIFKSIFHVCSSGVRDGSMTAIDAGAYMIHGANEILHKKDPRRVTAFGEIMEFIYKAHEDGKMDLKNSAYGLGLASETLLPEPFASHFAKTFAEIKDGTDLLAETVDARMKVDMILHGAPVSSYPSAQPTRF